ncbi:MAG TPA: ABC transporter ATP-binding protein [Chloroflexota bacterium]
MLAVEHVSAGYGDVRVLWDVSLVLQPGETTCLVGANGAGKTTLLRTLMGQIGAESGRVVYDGLGITHLATHRRVDLGLVLVPEGRQLFTNLTVQDNLDLGATPRAGRARYAETLAWVFELFPRLKERRLQPAGTLSGGEQQMLAIGRGLMAAPKILMLDEPSLGLAPTLVLSVFQIIKQLRATGLTMLLVEQNLHLALAVGQKAYVLSEGRIAVSGPAAEVREMPEVRKAYLGA